MIGLLLIAVGTGGIKPCVSAFGGDQFTSAQVRNYLMYCMLGPFCKPPTGDVGILIQSSFIYVK